MFVGSEAVAAWRRGRWWLVAAVVNQLRSKFFPARRHICYRFFGGTVLARPRGHRWRCRALLRPRRWKTWRRKRSTLDRMVWVARGVGMEEARSSGAASTGSSGASLAMAAQTFVSKYVRNRWQPILRLDCRHVVDVGRVVRRVACKMRRLMPAGKALMQRSRLDHPFVCELLVRWWNDGQAGRRSLPGCHGRFEPTGGETLTFSLACAVGALCIFL